MAGRRPALPACAIPAAAAPAALLALLLAGCSGGKVEPPPRTDTAPPSAQEASVITVPVDMDAAVLTRAIETAIPRELWTIDQHSSRCVKPQRLNILGARLKVTPPISCTIVGSVTRGPIRLRGEGREIVAELPINARISARDIGGVLKGETATGSAMVHARIRLDLGPDWQPRGTVRLHYDWTTPPGIDFLGQRITFAERADEKLQPVLRNLERTLPRELARVDLPEKVGSLWRRSFTSVLLNEHDPPVWMRIAPRRLNYGGYAMRGGGLRLDLGLEAVTETFVGERPPDPAPAPLPPPGEAGGERQLRFFIPVVASYAELEPVVLRALVRRARRPFELPGVGPITARFEKIVAYGTTEGRIALGITLAARPVSGGMAETRGRIWLTARPVNAENSAVIAFEDLAIAGDTDGVGGNLLIRLGQAPVIAEMIAESLTQNFSGDLDKLLGKIRKAIEEKREGDFVVEARIGAVETGRIAAYGAGLYLPVRATGEAHVTYSAPVRAGAPRRRAKPASS